jgi:hypothetical protein
MPFNLSSWLHRKKIHAHVQLSGRPMQHHRVVNPYHAVSIMHQAGCCVEVAGLEGRRFLASAAPTIPLRDCEAASCRCRYVHYEDRRGEDERRILAFDARGIGKEERRHSRGRRESD